MFGGNSAVVMRTLSSWGSVLFALLFLVAGPTLYQHLRSPADSQIDQGATSRPDELAQEATTKVSDAAEEHGTDRSGRRTRPTPELTGARHILSSWATDALARSEEERSFLRERQEKRERIREQVEYETLQETFVRLLAEPPYSMFTPFHSRYGGAGGFPGQPYREFNELSEDPRVAKLRRILAEGPPGDRDALLHMLRDLARAYAESPSNLPPLRDRLRPWTARDIFPVLLAEADPSAGTLALLGYMWESAMLTPGQHDDTGQRVIWSSQDWTPNMLYVAAVQLFDQCERDQIGPLTPEQLRVVAFYSDHWTGYHEELRTWMGQAKPEELREVAHLASQLESLPKPDWETLADHCPNCIPFGLRREEIMRLAVQFSYAADDLY